ncbi:MAG: nucleoside triphosphate pyrophosphatase [Verrucomicrobiota bacterium]|nr:nucleoside triphosphate pyrophosphatase [Verrucomicrobiota bacterium]
MPDSAATMGSARTPPGLVLLLASASPRRRQLLTELGVAIRVEASAVTEWEHPDADPEALVTHNAQKKARAMAEKYPDIPVLGADTTVALDGEVLNKPADLVEARQMLGKLSDREHTVFTAVSLIWRDRGLEDTRCITSRVRFHELDADTITRYFEIVNPLDKAGAYGIQEGRELIIHSWQGSLTNIMGLPIEVVTDMLAPLGLIAKHSAASTDES